MRLLQLEHAFADEPKRAQLYALGALGSDTCWVCAGCLACTSRCPQGVDIAGTMEVLRQEAVRRGVASTSKKAKSIRSLHEVFLGEALKRGRIHEVSMVMRYKLRTGKFLADATLAPVMWAKGQLHLLPKESQDMTRVRQAIDKLKKG